MAARHVQDELPRCVWRLSDMRGARGVFGVLRAFTVPGEQPRDAADEQTSDVRPSGMRRKEAVRGGVAGRAAGCARGRGRAEEGRGGQRRAEEGKGGQRRAEEGRGGQGASLCDNVRTRPCAELDEGARVRGLVAQGAHPRHSHLIPMVVTDTDSRSLPILKFT